MFFHERLRSIENRSHWVLEQAGTALVPPARFPVRTAFIQTTPASEVAFDAGFGDFSEFNRRFRRFTGATPVVFRPR
ncbi:MULTISPECIES: helix-turn-helix domain-containing protein [unclassified Sphingopyxis]|uniref:helix-turn-helix domain-containing protein n=1 Tax=unclassified Sphingopyxis TaxID=2614943 RepID=UPI0012E34A83|nr:MULTISPECIES: helix-turn-helix domain-containing protein [unclassified Sphingopyxis]